MNNPTSFLPNPQDLVTKSKTDDAVAISVRIKPTTKQFFEQIATENKGISINFLVNEVLDAYVSHYTNPTTAPISQTLGTYLRAEAEKIQHFEDEDLLARVYNHSHFTFHTGALEPLGSLDTVAHLDDIKSSQDTSPLVATAIISQSDINGDEVSSEDYTHLFEFVCANHIHAKNAAYSADDIHARPTEDPYYNFRDIDIRPKYWAMTVAMANAYLHKLSALLPGYQVVMTNSFARELVVIINRTEHRHDLPARLAEAFTNFAERTLDE